MQPVETGSRNCYVVLAHCRPDALSDLIGRLFGANRGMVKIEFRLYTFIGP